MITLKQILGVVGEEYGVSPKDLTRQTGIMTEARFLYCWLARRLTDKTYREIGEAISRHYTSAMYGERCCNVHRNIDDEYFDLTNKLFVKLAPRLEPPERRLTTNVRYNPPIDPGGPVAKLDRRPMAHRASELLDRTTTEALRARVLAQVSSQRLPGDLPSTGGGLTAPADFSGDGL